MSVGLPEGYVQVEAGGVRGFAWSGAAAWVESIARAGASLYEWATGRDAPVPGGGRAPIRVMSARAVGPDGRASWAVRRYRRGGAAARVLADRYVRLGESRPERELGTSVVARERGVRTPAVVAGAAYPAGAFYRADLVTELLPDAPSLAEALFGERPVPGACERLGSAGRLVGALERARVVHADLNAANIVLPPGGAAADAWVVDLDRCRVLPLEGPAPGAVMRRRLERSLRKLGARHGRPLSAPEWEALQAGYEAGA